MKRTLILFLLIANYCNSQSFVKIGDRIMSEVEFLAEYETIKQGYFPKKTDLNFFEKITRNDSLIKNAIISVYMNESERAPGYFHLLNNPFPSFRLKDSSDKMHDSSSLIDKPTLVCILSSSTIPRRKQIKALNSLNANSEFNVIGFIKDQNMKRSQIRKIKFPISLNTSNWLNDNFKNYYFPKYLILDHKGIVTYLFPDYPDAKTKYEPIDRIHKTIFNVLSK